MGCVAVNGSLPRATVTHNAVFHLTIDAAMVLKKITMSTSEFASEQI